MANEYEQVSPIINERPPVLPQVDLKDRNMQLFVGEKYQSYYKEKFDQITPKKQMAGFNIAAFFLGILWLFYRKMYGYGFIAIALIFVLGFVEEMMGITGLGSNIGLSVAFGLFGNSLYKHYALKKIAHLNSNDDIEKVGGTNIWAALAVLIIVILLVVSGYALEIND